VILDKRVVRGDRMGDRFSGPHLMDGQFQSTGEIYLTPRPQLAG